MSRPQQAVAKEPPRAEGRPSRRGTELEVDTFPIAPGKIVLEAGPEHRLLVHAGPPVRGRCRLHRLVYTRGDVDVVPAGVSEAWEAEGASVALVVRLSSSLLVRAADEMELGHCDLEPRHQFRDARIEHIAWALDADRRAGAPNGRLYREGLGLALAAHLLGRSAEPDGARLGLSRPQLRRVTSFIEENLDQELTLVTIAGIAGVSASHLKTLFKRSMGIPVHEYVIRRRVERARELLLGGELPASQVALAAGFSHQSHMARCMRRVLGLTPTQVSRRATGVG